MKQTVPLKDWKRALCPSEQMETTSQVKLIFLLLFPSPRPISIILYKTITLLLQWKVDSYFQRSKFTLVEDFSRLKILSH